MANNNNLLTKEDAIQALSEGKKVTHICFLENEYIYQDGNLYYDENGYSFTPELFWFDRRSDIFTMGWSIYES